jgi:hypothetical protein
MWLSECLIIEEYREDHAQGWETCFREVRTFQHFMYNLVPSLVANSASVVAAMAFPVVDSEGAATR